jgi:hypothetical protein
MLDPWIERAWQIHLETERFPVKTILKATLWLQNKHRLMPEWKTAVAVTLHYLILAIREELQKERPELVEDYLTQAARWQQEAIDQLARNTAREPKHL